LIIVLLYRAPQLINGNSSTAHLGRSTWHPRAVISMIRATGASITYKEACLREIMLKEIGNMKKGLHVSFFSATSSFNQKYSLWTNGTWSFFVFLP